MLSLQEFGNRAGAFPRNPAKLVGAKVSNTFDTEGGPVVFGGRVTEYLFARITGQGMTPLCAPSDVFNQKALHLIYLNHARMPACLRVPVVVGQRLPKPAEQATMSCCNSAVLKDSTCSAAYPLQVGGGV